MSARLILGTICVFVYLLLPLHANAVNWIYNPTTDHYYALTQRGDWDQAQAEAISNNAYLVTINDAAESTWLLQNFTDAGTEDNCWIGLSDTAIEGTYVWANGDPLSYTNWDSGEPNNQGNEDYIYMFMQNNVNSKTPGLWNDVNDGGIAQGGQMGIIERDTPVALPISTPLSITTTIGLLLLSFRFLKQRRIQD